MVLGRVTHYAVDLVLVSTVLAGVKRGTGFTPKLTDLPEGTAQSVAGTYLGIGEKVFDTLSAYSYTSQYFVRAEKGETTLRRH